MILLQMPEFIETLGETGFGRVLTTFIIAMIPVVELRGAIPFGVIMGLPPLASALISALGNMVPVPFIILFVRKVFDWMKKWGGFLERVALWFERRGENKSSALEKGEFWGLMIFAGIPLPGTGAWTGALIAAMLGMRLKKAMPSIALGVLIAAIAVTILTVGVSHLLG